MGRRNPFDPTGAADHVASATPDMFFTRDQLAQLLGPFGGGVGAMGTVGAPAAGGNQGGMQSVIEAVQAKIDEANAANEARYAQGLATIDSGKSEQMKMIQDIFGQILGNGTSTAPALAREDKRAKAAYGAAAGALTSRGLGNTNLLADVQRGVADDSAIRQEEIHNTSRQEQNAWQAQLGQMLMGVLQNFTKDKTGFIERRTDQGPDLNALAQIYSQPGANGFNPIVNRGITGRRGNAGAPLTMGGWSMRGTDPGSSQGGATLALPQGNLTAPGKLPETRITPRRTDAWSANY